MSTRPKHASRSRHGKAPSPSTYLSQDRVNQAFTKFAAQFLADEPLLLGILSSVTSRLLVDVGDQILNLQDSHSLWQKLGECARKRVEATLNWEAQSKKVLEAYKALLAKQVLRPVDVLSHGTHWRINQQTWLYALLTPSLTVSPGALLFYLFDRMNLPPVCANLGIVLGNAFHRDGPANLGKVAG